MLFRVTTQGDSGIVHVEGEIDMAGAETFERDLRSALDDADGHDVDMSGVTFIDSAGLRALYRCSEHLNGTGPLVIVNPSRFVSTLMKIAGFEDSDRIAISDTRA